MENTLTNKARFFAQYWWQKLFVINGNNEDTYNNWRTEDLDKGYMLLTPLSDITDEDAIEVAKIENSYEDALTRGKVLVNTFIKYIDCSHSMKNSLQFINMIDYFRSKGYALPWNGLTVEEQIEFGWVKLKTLNK